MDQAETLPTADAATTESGSGGGAIKKIALVLIAIGGVLSLMAYMDEGARTRFGFAYLLGFLFCWAIVLGSLFFVALQHVTNSIWSVSIRRVAEMLAAPIWVLALMFIPLLAFALLNKDFGIFPWMRAEHDHILEAKAPYLNDTFFLVRTVAFFVIWIAFAFFFVRGSIRQDAGGDGRAAGTKRMRNVSGPFIIVFGFTATFASFDWVMSLEPHWFSTIYGVYVFGGMFLAALAAITIGVIWLRGRGVLDAKLVTRDHLYSLGGLLFAFTCFWAYISFSQFMLIWYGNLPEETIYYVKRLENGWFTVSMLVVALRFVLPFFLLLSRGAKMNAKRLVQVSVLVLLGQLVDLYWLIMPAAQGATPTLGWQEFGPTALFTGVLLLYVAVFLGKHKAVAAGDPFFEKSRDFHL